MIAPDIDPRDEQAMTDRVREQIATLLADAELLRAGGNAKSAERMARDAARLRRRAERHMATRDARAGKWEAHALDGFVAALELMTGEVPEATGLKLPTGDNPTDASCALLAPDSTAPAARPHNGAATPLTGSQCSDGYASTRTEGCTRTNGD